RDRRPGAGGDPGGAAPQRDDGLVGAAPRGHRRLSRMAGPGRGGERGRGPDSCRGHSVRSMSAGECVAELPVARAIGRLLPVTLATALAWTLYAAALGVAVVLRVWNLDALGYNSDEAVYAGQAASIAGVPELTPFFP